MNHSATTPSNTDWKQLDARIRQVDEERWLSSRYAKQPERRALLALYGLNYELARVRVSVTEPGLGAIRFQWWRDAIDLVEGGENARHEVALALQTPVDEGLLHIDALHKLIDGHEIAFERDDRAAEPEAHLAAIAARIFTSAHGWGQEIAELAPHWAALRRGERVGFGPVVAPAPADIRPAIAHYRLRRIMGKEGRPSRIAQRICVLRGILSGAV